MQFSIFGSKADKVVQPVPQVSEVTKATPTPVVTVKPQLRSEEMAKNDDDLIALKRQLDELSKKYQEAVSNKKADAIANVKSIIAEFGITASELGFTGGEKSKFTRKPAKPKYILNGATWTGRGKMPKVFKEQIARGKKIEEFLIK